MRRPNKFIHTTYARRRRGNLLGGPLRVLERYSLTSLLDFRLIDGFRSQQRCVLRHRNSSFKV
jgi:hypothetical protein